jgi:hypothetical protein
MRSFHLENIQKVWIVDDKSFRVQEPSDSGLLMLIYNGSALVTGVLCFSVDGLIIWANHNCIDSWNDGATSRDLQGKNWIADTTVVKHSTGRIIPSNCE